MPPGLGQALKSQARQWGFIKTRAQASTGESQSLINYQNLICPSRQTTFPSLTTLNVAHSANNAISASGTSANRASTDELYVVNKVRDYSYKYGATEALYNCRSYNLAKEGTVDMKQLCSDEQDIHTGCGALHTYMNGSEWLYAQTNPT
ncbi:hypothetical protein EDD18DRAFT_1326549 [Armillaria luteobubalina]|uniref:Extracellular metalloproteinase n=1 Tax=Armillaria luteobubalina TaxID=153913 RepID=A0AA39UVY2_9AGAR|nr:hypothetical protein EDD18DRAFT_1326549 [Armillaria luteobubalina]